MEIAFFHLPQLLKGSKKISSKYTPMEGGVLFTGGVRGISWEVVSEKIACLRKRGWRTLGPCQCCFVSCLGLVSEGTRLLKCELKCPTVAY